MFKLILIGHAIAVVVGNPGKSGGSGESAVTVDFSEEVHSSEVDRLRAGRGIEVGTGNEIVVFTKIETELEQLFGISPIRSGGGGDGVVIRVPGGVVPASGGVDKLPSVDGFETKIAANG